ncbi:MAG TPA: hypothetical protein PLD47_10360 [Aggregatilineales bacterium]|nr:hypothetical protein [Anaerolineales bacterium]HRE48117.1 hypothetical protein [Aggregatilineales bacterium]
MLNNTQLNNTPPTARTTAEIPIPTPEPPPAPPRSEEQERNAMRAYLQRSETRLSTMHRVAVGFLSGAGLLFLLPVFFKDAILTIIRELLDYPATMPPEITSRGLAVVILLYATLLFPFVLTIGVPVIALVQLLRDIVRFYFTGQAPGFPETYFNPCFSLTGVAFSPDESEVIKAKAMMFQYGTDLTNFIVPFDEISAHYFDEVIDLPERNVVPRTRKLPFLVRQKVVHIDGERSFDDLHENDPLTVPQRFNGSTILPEARHRNVKDIDRFNAALGLAGFIERPLYQEVAKLEVSLVRHALNLRRLVLRYFQALLIFLWTMLVSFTMLLFLADKDMPNFLVFIIGYGIWAIGTPFIVELPVRWLVGDFPRRQRRAALRKLQRSDGLQRFAKWVKWTCYVALILLAISVIIEVAFRVQGS